MTFDEWFVKYPLPAEIDTMDDTDREQWTWALRSAYKTGAASKREWVGLTDEELSDFDVDPVEAKAMIQRLKEKNT
jgi:hypothetical protein